MSSISGTERAIIGGINSGRHRSVHRGAVEHHPALDLRILRRAGLLQPGQCTYDTVHWRNQAKTALRARIFIDLSDDDDSSLRVITPSGGGTIDQRIAIEIVECRFGGARCYFLCPIIGTRCQLLYLVDGLFASRKAHSLTYAVQSEDDLSRARRKARTLHRQVDGDARYPRPRGRKRWNLVERLKSAESNARAVYHERLCGMVADRG